jgi:hypothetical protein
MPSEHRKSRSRAELVENSGKVLYKIWMFAQTNRLVLASPRSSEGLGLDEQVQFMALLEAMLGHARELMCFLYAAPAKNYIRAVDYLPDPSVLPPTKWAGYEKDLARLNNSLTHLTYAREPESVTWTVAGNLTPPLLTFVKEVPQELVQAKFRDIAGHTLLDQSSLCRYTVAPRDGSKPPVRGYRVHELFED